MTDPRAPAVRLLQFDRLTGVRHGISTRHGGVSQAPYASLNLGFSTADDEDRVAENRARFARALGAPSDQLMTAHLTHGNEVAVFAADRPDSWPAVWYPVRPESNRHAWSFRTDGVVSDVVGLTFLLTAADCTPLLFWDRALCVIGAAHAGWRGTARGIAGNVVRAMTDAFGTRAADVVVGIGPSIGPCCYTVRADVIETFAREDNVPVLREENGRQYLDMWATNREQLLAAGIPANSIESMDMCTGCKVDSFFSHRAEGGLTGRLACAIGLG